MQRIAGLPRLAHRPQEAVEVLALALHLVLWPVLQSIIEIVADRAGPDMHGAAHIGDFPAEGCLAQLLQVVTANLHPARRWAYQPGRQLQHLGAA